MHRLSAALGCPKVDSTAGPRQLKPLTNVELQADKYGIPTSAEMAQ